VSRNTYVNRICPDIALVVAESYIQSSQEKNDGTTAIKRQKVPHQKTMRSRSTIDEKRKGGRGRLDCTDCATENDVQKRINDFWAPPEFGGLKNGLKTGLPRATGSVADGMQDTYESLPRRHSDSFLSPRSGQYITPPPDTLGPSVGISRKPVQTTMFPPIGTSRYVPRPRNRTSPRANEVSLEDRMHTLLLTPGNDKEPEVFEASQLVADKRLKRAEERETKEREAAIRNARELRLRRRDPPKALVQPLNNKWECVVNEAQRTNNHHQVITTSIGGIELRLKDFQTLLGRHAWLNDEIINSYIEWVVDAANHMAATQSHASGHKASKVPKFIAHNSFFYNNLIKKGPASTQGLMKSKKAPGVALMEVDSVFVPICKGSHWTVGVVRPIAKTIEYFDSMGGSPQTFFGLMRNWLKFQLGDAFIEEEWSTPRTACAHQSNGYDCGVFVCTNAFCVAFGLHTSCYKESDMAQQRRNIAAVLINRGFTGDFAWTETGLL
jgi:sentrin-specific protease 1